MQSLHLLTRSILVLMAVLTAAAHAAEDERRDSPEVPQAGLKLWLRADDGVVVKDGTVVAWQDASAAGNHARWEQAFGPAGRNPAVVPDAANGNPVLRFDGSDIAFQFPRQADIRTVFFVVRKDPKASGQANERFVLGEGMGKDFHVGTHKTNFILHPNESAANLRRGVTRVNGQVVDPVKTNFGGSLAVVSMVAAGPVAADQVAKDRQFKGRSWQGDIAEILLYDAPLADAARERVETYLARKYGIGAVTTRPTTKAATKDDPAAVAAASADPASNANWPRWRGPNADGVAPATRLPTTWSVDSHVAWKTDVPGSGNSSPCVWGDRIFLTAADAPGMSPVSKTRVLCFDRATGKPLWDTPVPILSRPKELSNENNGWATPTPACDGTHVVAAFATGTVACLAMDGRLQWTFDLGPIDHLWGLAASPMLFEDHTYYAVDQGKRSSQPSFLSAIVLETGKEAWRKVIATSGERGYSTPLLRPGADPEILLWAGDKLTAYDARSGDVRWAAATFPLGEPITSPLFTADGKVVVAQSNHAMALELTPGGTRTLWSIGPSDKARFARITDSIVYRGRLYAASQVRRLVCHDPATGVQVWSAEVHDAFYAAPVAAAGHVYFTGRSGNVYVLKAGDRFELVATNSLGEPTDVSPAVADDRLYLRTRNGRTTTTLWCIEP